MEFPSGPLLSLSLLSLLVVCGREPPREKGQQLPPNARPQLIQQRVQVLYSGNWAELLDPLVRDLPEPRPDQTPSTRRGPQTPGLIQPGDARRILQTAQEGRVTTAWNQLFGYGLASPSPEVTAQVKAKWGNPTMAGPAVDHLPRPLPADLEQLYAPKRMLAVRQRLKHRACADAIGWTQCVMSQVLGREQAVPVITAHLRRYSMGLMSNHSSS
eukprot:80984-Amphidinium_carterae.2